MWELKRAVEGAVAPFDAVMLFAGAGQASPCAGQSHPILLHVNLEVLAFQSRQLRDYHVVRSRFIQIDRWHPAGGPWRETVQALLDGEEVA